MVPGNVLDVMETGIIIGLKKIPTRIFEEGKLTK